MRSSVALLVGLAVLSGAPVAAQGPVGPGMPMRMPMGMAMAPFRAPGAEFLLASTGPLHLTDQQVTRLAAIARRAAARREAMRLRADSLRTPPTPGVRPDSATRRARAGMLVQAVRETREQERTDLRDALTVLTPDQLVTAWEMISARGMRAGPAVRATGAGALRMRSNRLRGMGQPPRGMVPPPPPGPPQP